MTICVLSFPWKKYCKWNKPKADASGVDLEVEVLAILVYSNNCSSNFSELFKALFTEFTPLPGQQVGNAGSLLSLVPYTI